MKKNLMNHAAGRMVLTFFFCCAMTTTVVNAQEAESLIKKGERLAKAANDAPQDSHEILMTEYRQLMKD